MATSERNIKNEILLDLGQARDVYIQNQPTGVFRAMDSDRVIRVGNPGQSDLLAIVAVTITPDMVGQVIGAAVFIETKTATGRQRDNQKLFQLAVERRGALYLVARSVECVRAGLARRFPFSFGPK